MQENLQIIHAVTFLATRVSCSLEVGQEYRGREVIEIIREGDRFKAYDEDDEVICVIEQAGNTPLLIDYKTIVVDGPEEQRSLVRRRAAETEE